MAVLSVLGLIIGAQALAPPKGIMQVDASGSFVELNDTLKKKQGDPSKVTVLVYGEAG